jgi:hypothetical protein
MFEGIVLAFDVAAIGSNRQSLDGEEKRERVLEQEQPQRRPSPAVFAECGEKAMDRAMRSWMR